MSLPITIEASAKFVFNFRAESCETITCWAKVNHFSILLEKETNEINKKWKINVGGNKGRITKGLILANQNKPRKDLLAQEEKLHEWKVKSLLLLLITVSCVMTGK